MERDNRLTINQDQYLELEKLALGVFAPLSGFMDEDDFFSCVKTMRLKDKSPFPIPIVFDVGKEDLPRLKRCRTIELFFNGARVGMLRPASFYRPNKKEVALSVFKTDDPRHPGVHHLSGMGECFIGGRVKMLKRPTFDFSRYELTPDQTKAYFKKMKWDTVVGFQTRNVPHRAHEHLQKAALELVDGLFIQPLVGKKKPGDFTPMAIIKGYKALINNYYPKDRVLFGILSTLMRYAGPREAVFHAIIRRNYGCTHFIVGRDHAGVGSYYGKYDAHALVAKFKDLSIEIFDMKGPYLCIKCDGIVTEKTCPHKDDHPEYSRQISGTLIREMLKSSKKIDPRLIRPEVVEALKGERIFI